MPDKLKRPEEAPGTTCCSCGQHPAGSDCYADLRDRYEERARVLKAMAHPARLYILDRLSAGECTVMELTDAIGCEMPTVSRHLAILRNAGIVTGTKRGSNVFYTLEVPCVLNFFGCIEEVIRERGGKETQ